MWMAAYDWRLPFAQLEARDQLFSLVRVRVRVRIRLTLTPTLTLPLTLTPAPTLTLTKARDQFFSRLRFHIEMFRRVHGSTATKCAPWQRPLAAPQLGCRASSGRAWRLWAARHSREEAGPLSAQPLPRVLELAASKAANSTAVDHPGTAPRWPSSATPWAARSGSTSSSGSSRRTVPRSPPPGSMRTSSASCSSGHRCWAHPRSSLGCSWVKAALGLG